MATCKNRGQGSRECARTFLVPYSQWLAPVDVKNIKTDDETSKKQTETDNQRRVVGHITKEGNSGSAAASLGKNTPKTNVDGMRKDWITHPMLYKIDKKPLWKVFLNMARRAAQEWKRDYPTDKPSFIRLRRSSNLLWG